jgi:dTDP-4-dehydrorhamnose 3,5-epimerase-like enzyme
MQNTSMITFKEIADEYGCLVPIEAQGDVPFEVKRIYYIYHVANGVRRGFHSHNDLHQALICVKGHVKILVKTPFEEQIVDLHNPAEGLYIGPMIWREMYDFSEDAVLLVLASEHYDESDYVRNYEAYEKIARKYFDK